MADSVKKQIVAQIKTVLEALKASASVQEVSQRRGINAPGKLKKGIHFVIGDEDVVVEDNFGFNCSFQVLIKCYYSDPNSSYGDAMDFVAAVQTAMEADRQLGGLANNLVYLGEVDMTTEETWTQGTALLGYRVEYRRKYGAPETNY